MADEWTDALNIATATLNTVNNSIGSKKTLKYSKEFANFQNVLNRENYEYETQKNIELWNMQNQYNSPAETIQRLLAAGINPLTASDKFEPAGSPATAKTENPDLAAAYQAQIAQLQFEQQAQLANAQIAKMNAETKNIDANTNLTRSQEQQTSIQNDFLPQLLDGDIRMKDSQIILYGEQSKVPQAEVDNLYKKVEEIDASIQNIKENTEWIKQQKNLTEKQVDAFEKEFEVKLDNLKKQGKLTDAQIVVARASAGLNAALARGANAEAALKEFEQQINKATKQGIINDRWIRFGLNGLAFDTARGQNEIFRLQLPGWKKIAPFQPYLQGFQLGSQAVSSFLNIPGQIIDLETKPMQFGTNLLGTFLK